MRFNITVLFLCIFVSTGCALICDYCSDKCSCLRPKEVTCSHYDRCFESKDVFGDVIRKGCTKNCLHISNSCKQCSWDHCNHDYPEKRKALVGAECRYDEGEDESSGVQDVQGNCFLVAVVCILFILEQ
uniref:Venom protein n=1 Tax=Steinernema glaseri TaxID=37863 RepID=A0A1I7ZNS1_9BILA